jgi:gamma-glutamyltranspeptidase / glutathione hydrolase
MPLKMNKTVRFAAFALILFIPLSIFWITCKTPEVKIQPKSVPTNSQNVGRSTNKNYTEYSAHKTVIADSAVVSTAHPLASKVGLDILKQGGNAIDASIAVQFALAVVYPRAGNLGGGGFMVYRSGDGKEISTLDYREKAPLAGHRDMYLDKNGNVVPHMSQKGTAASGVPGTVNGCYSMFLKYSKLKDWKKLVQPSIDLAEKGFAMTDLEARRLNTSKKDFVEHNTMPTALIKKDTQDWSKGDILVQKELAHTLVLIRDKNVAGFYEGETAQKIVDEMKRGNGLITLEDLKKYKSVWRKPLIGQYKGHDIITMPPPSSGGIAMLQLMSIVNDYPLSKYGFHTPESIHLIVEAERRVYADRSEHLGDADFYPVQVKKLLNKDYLKKRFEDFDPTKATPSKNITPGDLAAVSEQTTHFCIVDNEGNAVSLTTTLNDNYGCKTVVGGAGFLLNNEMDDFSSKPGVPNMYGAIGGEANSIQPQKRPLSSMTPTIVTKDGKLFMVVGTPGGTTIITSVFQTITNVIDFKMSGTEATHARRFHSQWAPDILFIEKNTFTPELIETLTKMGHKVQERYHLGLVETILVRSDKKLEGVADDRGDDDAVGY